MDRSPEVAVLSMSRRRWAWGAALAAAVVVVLVWLLWPAHEAGSPPRARQYLDFDACLLTDAHGIAGAAAAPVWAGMQQASLDTRARVSFLSVSGPDTEANALPYLASLVQRGCEVVLAVGPAEIAAVGTDAPRNPSVRFVVVGGTATGGNVTHVDASPPNRVTAAVRTAVTSAVPATSR